MAEDNAASGQPLPSPGSPLIHANLIAPTPDGSALLLGNEQGIFELRDLSLDLHQVRSWTVRSLAALCVVITPTVGRSAPPAGSPA